jgi:hypothetical protein
VGSNVQEAIVDGGAYRVDCAGVWSLESDDDDRRQRSNKLNPSLEPVARQ